MPRAPTKTTIAKDEHQLLERQGFFASSPID
jgi:hypothetical protein